MIEVPDEYFLEHKLDQLESCCATVSTVDSYMNDLSEKINYLENKNNELERKFNTLLEIVEKNFPSEIKLYLELFGKDPD